MMRFVVSLAAGAAAALLACSGSLALADGPAPSKAKSTKDAAPADEGRKLTWSWNIGGTTDYIFRGISQNAGRPTPQGGVDITYGIFYAGAWGSGVNFGDNPQPDGRAVAGTEVDIYAGIKPVWGPVTFDLGVIYYWYPEQNAHGPKFGQFRDNNYVEAKLGASMQPITNLTTGINVFLSPQYTSGQGFTQTVEGTIAYELPKIHQIVPTIGGTLGGVFGDASDVKDPFVFANGKDSYLYWNSGITFGLDKLSLDLRYWDTNIPDSGRLVGKGFCSGNVGSGEILYCDSRFVGTVKVTF